MFACKMFLNVPIKTPNDTVYGKFGRYPLLVLSMIRCVKNWFRLLRQPYNFCSEQAYIMFVGFYEKGNTGWGIAYRVTSMPGWICPCVVVWMR